MAMDWILRKSEKLRYHTQLDEVTKPFFDEIDKYDWLLSDLDFLTNKLPNLPIDFDHDYFLLTPSKFKKLVLADVQIIWGSILAIPKDSQIEVNEDNLPYVEGNDKIWKVGNIQHDRAEIEINCFDSSYTIVKFRNKFTSDRFREYFEEAIELDKFK